MLSSLSQARINELPTGFSETLIANNIQNPVGMEISPDGRLFVLAGFVRRVEVFDDSGYLNEFIRLPQAANLGSGLLGLEFSPDFSVSGDVYIAYVANTDTVPSVQVFRLSRFSSDGTVADADSEEILFEIEDINPDQQLHQGGDLVIGDDGKIYWALGDRVRGSVVSQPLNSLYGKLLRLNLDGTIPADNPFYTTLNGDLRAIYANGLRNPYRMDLRSSTGEIFMSEVGNAEWEELNRVEQAANYGWPIYEGSSFEPGFTDPIYAYPHIENALPSDLFGCAITGGSFYEPETQLFPADFSDKFFYADHCFGWIAYLDVETGIDTEFATGASRLVEVKVHPLSGAIYYLDREYAGDNTGPKGGIGRISYISDTLELEITSHPASLEAAVGGPASFEVFVTGETPITFQWYRDSALLPGQTSSTLNISNVSVADDGSEFFVEVTDASGNIEVSNTATLTIAANNAPSATILLPTTSELYVAGEEYIFEAIAEDIEDGELNASAFDWEIVFHHDDHVHPFIPEIPGVKSGIFVPGTTNETEPNVWYRIHLTVTDSAGSSQSVQRDIYPVLADVIVESNPPGLDVLIDGIQQTSPAEFEGVAGVLRDLEAPASQLVNGEAWTFSGWSNGGNRIQTIATPAIPTTYIANYSPPDGGPDLPPVAGLLSPEGETSIPGPVTISGIATDDVGVIRVQITVRESGTTNHWNGTSFEPGWRTVDALLESPGATQTAWSYVFAPESEVEVTIVAQARQDGAWGNKERIDNVVVTEDEPPIDPFIIVESPEHQSVQGNTVTFSGTVELDNLSFVKVVVKDFYAPIYWNGNDWQSSRIELDALVTGNNWSYLLDYPGATRDIMFRAVASDGVLSSNPDRIRIFSDRTVIFAD